MRPLSDVIPKPALPLPGGPVIAWPLRLAASTGATVLTVNTWWLAEQMEAAARAAVPAGLACAVSREQDLMDTAGGIALARDRGLLGADGPVLVVNGDGVMDLDLAALLEAHTSSGHLVTLALRPHPDPSRWSRVVVDPGGRVAAIHTPGAPVADDQPLLYPGAMVVSRAALDRLVARPGGVATHLWGPALRADRLGGVVVDGHWREVGTPTDYLATVHALLAGGRSLAASSDVDPTATVTASLIGPGVIVGPEARVEHSVVSHGAVIHRRAALTRSVVFGEVEAEPGEVLLDVVRVPGRPDQPTTP